MIYFFVVLIVPGLILFFYWLSKPLYHKGKMVEDFPVFLQRYFQLGAEGSFLKIEHETSERFIQYVKYRQGDSLFLRLGFPDAPWSRGYYGDVINELKAANVKFQLVRTGEAVVREFVYIDNIADVDQAVHAAKIVLNGMDLAEDEKYTIYFEGSFLESAGKEVRSEIRRIREGRNGNSS